ncbi:ParB/RepB/Spo0J family partition protein [Clostridium sardiniense]|uniref:ParB/RepB/Spo0J family partition protein n=1 Tax=Clostridium sardiniense TaxID=29369 RepID=A0ABS7L2M7_CLOSR|nr:ParB/RepB/Spo0J family partition protein [Clostridium sardiniense]MBY0757333.1 ParB/RepB/Spo0J family partition protein [Clostridium sardiniense]MDQ0458505.1 ParB family chromosome partitioning protein [Clostridium sardiniense]
MSKSFSISEGMLNSISKNVQKASKLEAKENFKVQYIDIKDINRSNKNFYEIVNIDELAEDIKLNGLNHNLVVRKLGNESYELLSGERRYTALTKLVNEGNKTFALVPCKVIEANDTDAEIILIQANAQTRELSDIEKLKQIQRLKELYQNKKKNGEKIPGKIREIIANDLKLSPTQVGRYERINNKLIPELKEVLENGNLTINNASEFSTLSETNQKAILDIINSKVNLSKEEASQLKSKLKRLETEKDLELENNKNLIKENRDLKQKITSSDESKNNENEIKELEGQLKIKLEKELEQKYSSKIESIKQEVINNQKEKEELKNQLSKLKASAPKDVSKEFEENLKLIQDLKIVKSTLLSISKQYRKMKNDDINISNETLNLTKDTLDVSYILTSMNTSK